MMIVCTYLSNKNLQARRHGKGTFLAVACVKKLQSQGMEGEPGTYVQKWLCTHRDAFDAHGPNDEKLFATEWSSDSWTIETPSRTSSISSSAGGEGPPGQELGLLGVDSLGGGDLEEAPNNWAGGSYPVASMQKIRPGGALITKLQLQANLAEYVNEEIGHVGITGLVQWGAKPSCVA